MKIFASRLKTRRGVTPRRKPFFLWEQLTARLGKVVQFFLRLYRMKQCCQTLQSEQGWVKTMAEKSKSNHIILVSGIFRRPGVGVTTYEARFAKYPEAIDGITSKTLKFKQLTKLRYGTKPLQLNFKVSPALACRNHTWLRQAGTFSPLISTFSGWQHGAI